MLRTLALIVKDEELSTHRRERDSTAAPDYHYENLPLDPSVSIPGVDARSTSEANVKEIRCKGSKIATARRFCTARRSGRRVPRIARRGGVRPFSCRGKIDVRILVWQSRALTPEEAC